MNEPTAEVHSSRAYPPWYSRQLKHKYGISVEDYDRLLVDQGFACKICKSKESKDKRKKSYRKLDIDHDHATGKIRGLLCSSCNRMLGMAEDNPEILLKAIRYLQGKL